MGCVGPWSRAPVESMVLNGFIIFGKAFHERIDQ